MMKRQYKNSGIPWIGEIPSDWNVVRTKNVFACSKSLVGEDWSHTQLLSLTTKGVKEVAIGSTSGKVPDSYETYQVVQKDDLVMCLFDLDCSAVFSGVSNFHGMISPAYKVLKTLDGYSPAFYGYWFDYIFDGRKYRYLSKNIRYSLTYDEFAALGIAAPPPSTQQRIADFLDRKCAEIDELAALQETMIAELKRYKQSVITEAVTKGLDPNVPMQDSGVEWIGEIPEGWSVCRLKNIIATIRSGVSVNAELIPATNDEYGVLKTSSVSKNIFDIKENKRVNIEEYGRVSCPVKADTIIVSRMNTPELVGATGYCEYDVDNIFLPDRLWQVEFNRTVVNTKYSWYFLINNITKQYYSSLSSGTSSSMQNISQSQFENAVIILPPLTEQRAIADYLDKKCGEIDELIAIKQQKIEALKEYKKSVIFEYVTGKKEVLSFKF